MPATFSVVVPVHDVQDYLAECLDSILDQPFGDVEVIAIDDASHDGSPAVLDEYAARDDRVHVVHLPENVGLGHARNAGLELATGAYLLFVDSDDSLAPGALEAIAARIEATGDPDVVVFDFVRTHPTGEQKPDARSARLVSEDAAEFALTQRPGFLELFPVVWNKAYRRDFVEAGGFRFPTGFYEDLPWTYPVLVTASRIVTLDRVCYLYRQRSGQILRSADRRHLDFFTQFELVFDFLDAHPELAAWRGPLYDRLTRHAPWILEIPDRVSPELRRDFFRAASESFRRHRPAGFVAPSRSAAWKIRLIERGDYRAFRAAQVGNVAKRRIAARRTPPPPADVVSALVEDGRFGVAPAAAPPDLVATLRALDPRAVATRPGLPEQLRQALLVGVLGQPAPPPRRTVDRRRQLARFRYFTGETPPPERLLLDGAVVTPRHAKRRAVRYFGHTLAHERVLWAPLDARLELDGVDVTTAAAPAARADSALARARRLSRAVNPQLLKTILGDLLIRAAARRPAARRRYRDAWLLIDRDTEAHDNAEHLYRHLRAERKDVNAFFVLRRDSVDWNRLAQEGFRLIEFGCREHYVALLHCVQLVSSQVDTYVNQPFWQRFLGPAGWRFSFLQHGVTKDDLSRWINDKPIDLILSVTPEEQRGFTADETPYPYTTLDVPLTGFPRHDRLLALGRENENPRSLLVMPSWRQTMVGVSAGGNRRALQRDFWQSEFAQAWRAVLESDELRALAEANGWTITFVPHPNLQDYVDSSPLPAHVRTLRFRDIDVQRTLADAAVLVTDYSSLAFEAAYLERPVVYYQFDRDAFFAGGHAYRAGGWSYVEQGFGPVVDTPAQVLAALREVAAGDQPPQYAERARAAFPYRDGGCCARAVAAIEALRQPAPIEEIVSR